MKFSLLILAAVAAIFVAAPSSAEARDYCAGERRIIAYGHSGPVYAVYQIIGRDHYGRPVGRWVPVRSSYGGGGYCPPSGYGHHHGYSHGGYSHRSPYSRRSSGVNLSFSFGR